MKVVRWVGNSFILVGATLLFFVVYELVGTSLVTNRNQSALASEWDDDLLRPRSIPSGTASASPRPRPKKYTGPPPIARLIIPKIGVNRFVVEGTSLSRLAWGPGHYDNTALPGRPGSSAVACHRTGWGSPCIDVDRLRRGDQIILEAKDGCDTPPCRFVYSVTRLVTVEPKDIWVLKGDPNSNAKAKFTLTTCTPKYTSLKRLIVWADLTSKPAGAK